MELVGRQFGHILVTEVVGQGGMGDVYAGYDQKLERKVALKVLNSDQRLDEEARERLLREARALSKLDHPNICRIHDYIESADVDLLVLEYIDGRTLYDALSDRMTRGEKLRIARAIAEVLVQAHRAGIVHRDLKAENVMMTKSGEVKVLDFGLARWLQRARSRSSDRLQVAKPLLSADTAVAETLAMPKLVAGAHGTPSKREFLATAVGITLGTPLYMSPEQARGESLTPASDMFSFGLLLQILFTGQDPHPPGLAAREVILRVARGETLPVVGAPGDVTALINRLKQFAPADRPTAVETLERLEFLEEKPQRLARRAIVTVLAFIAALGAWRYTVDLKAERTLAIAARSEAERDRAAAESLIEFMLVDLRKKLDAVGRLEILDDVGVRALQYMQSLDPKTMSADQLARNAKALNQLGEVRVGQGKTPEAMTLFRRSLTFAMEAVKRDAKDADAQMVLGATHFWIGNGLRLQGNTSEALQHMREYMKAGDALVAIDPSKKEHQLERAYGHSGVAAILELDGRDAEALRHYEISLRIKEDLAAKYASDASAQAELARALNKVGNVLYNRGDLRGALAHSRREVEIYRSLLVLQPQQAQWKERLATSMAYLGRALFDTGDVDGAFALFQEELAIERQLTALDETNVVWKRAEAMTTRWIGDVLRLRGDREKAIEAYREARVKIAAAERQAPSFAAYLKADAAVIEAEYGSLLAERDPGAVSMIRAAVRRLEALPDGAARRQQLGRALFHLGEAIAAADASGAEAAWIRAEQLIEPVVAQKPSPMTMSLWTRILVRRKRLPEAAAALASLRNTGYATSELERLCSENGC